MNTPLTARGHFITDVEGEGDERTIKAEVAFHTDPDNPEYWDIWVREIPEEYHEHIGSGLLFECSFDADGTFNFNLIKQEPIDPEKLEQIKKEAAEISKKLLAAAR